MKTRLSCILSVLVSLTLLVRSEALRYVTDQLAFSFIYSFQLHIGLSRCTRSHWCYLSLQEALVTYVLLLVGRLRRRSRHAAVLCVAMCSQPPARTAEMRQPAFKADVFQYPGRQLSPTAASIADFDHRLRAPMSSYIMEGGPLHLRSLRECRKPIPSIEWAAALDTDDMRPAGALKASVRRRKSQQTLARSLVATA